jgi:hypothetical protein
MTARELTSAVKRNSSACQRRACSIESATVPSSLVRPPAEHSTR